MGAPTKFLLLAAGWICLVLGLIGVFLPVLPTTPFVLLAALCFSKGSERLHTWLRNQKLFGKIIQDWEQSGAIAPKAKYLATGMIVLLFSYTTLFVDVPLLLKVGLILMAVGVLAFIWSRPTPDRQENNSTDT